MPYQLSAVNRPGSAWSEFPFVAKAAPTYSFGILRVAVAKDSPHRAKGSPLGESMLEVTERGDEFSNGDRLGTSSILRYSDAYRIRK